MSELTLEQERALEIARRIVGRNAELMRRLSDYDGPSHD